MTPRIGVVAILLAGCHDLTSIGELAPDAGLPVETGPTCAPDMIRVGQGCAIEPASCRLQNLPRTCGPTHADSCCSYDLIDVDKEANGGEFSRGFDTSGTSKEDGIEVHGWQRENEAAARISSFHLDRYEVTVGRFKEFYRRYDLWLMDNPLPAEGAGRHWRNSGGAWHAYWKDKTNLYAADRAALDKTLDNPAICRPEIAGWLRAPGHEDDNRPMTCINWYEAYLFCIFEEARLPTEAEWNYAAAGGSQQRPFPWPPNMTMPRDAYANVDHQSTGDLRPVGSYPAGVGRFGQFDLAGNAIEWVHDRCGDCAAYPSNHPTDPIEMEGPPASPYTNIVARGGSYRFPWASARTAHRQQMSGGIGGRYSDLGWRCARNPLPR